MLGAADFDGEATSGDRLEVAWQPPASKFLPPHLVTWFGAAPRIVTAKHVRAHDEIALVAVAPVAADPIIPPNNLAGKATNCAHQAKSGFVQVQERWHARPFETAQQSKTRPRPRVTLLAIVVWHRHLETDRFRISATYGGESWHSSSTTLPRISKPRPPKARSASTTGSATNGRAVLAPQGLHAGLHHRARLHGQDQARVRQARRQDHRPLGRPGRQACRAGPTTSRRRRASPRTIR